MQVFIIWQFPPTDLIGRISSEQRQILAGAFCRGKQMLEDENVFQKARDAGALD